MAGFYRAHGGDYRNPHEDAVAGLIGHAANHWPLDVSHVLDLAAGSGEVTLAFTGATRIDAIDPYTAAAYQQRVGRPCEAMTFEQVAAGGLRGRRYSLVVCSFAMHLVDESRLPGLCWELTAIAGQMLILTPHKRPRVLPAWGWTLTHEHLLRRVRARLYGVQGAEKGLS